jgi:1-acyl-sn-glycerol-3-phosphate acyltransferase
MAEFKAGSFKVATRTNCPIIPVSIAHTADILRKHIPFVKTTKVVITYGEAIDVASLSNEEKKHLAPMVQAKVQEMLG